MSTNEGNERRTRVGGLVAVAAVEFISHQVRNRPCLLLTTSKSSNAFFLGGGAGGEMTLTTVSMLVCVRENTHLEDKGADSLKICMWKNKRKRLHALINDKADEGFSPLVLLAEWICRYVHFWRNTPNIVRMKYSAGALRFSKIKKSSRPLLHMLANDTCNVSGSPATRKATITLSYVKSWHISPKVSDAACSVAAHWRMHVWMTWSYSPSSFTKAKIAPPLCPSCLPNLEWLKIDPL